MSNSKVSIIVPVFNAAKHLSRCLDSCVLQGYEDKQIVIVNDGSTDLSQEIIDDYVSIYPTIIIKLTIPNSGPAHARKVGLENSSGEFIIFLDADDYLGKDALFNVVANQDRTKADLVVGQYALVMNSGVKQGKRFSSAAGEFGVISAFLRHQLPITLWAVLYRRSILESVNFFDYQVGEDFVINCQIYSIKKLNVSVIPEVIYFYQRHDDSLTKSINDSKTEQARLAYEKGISIILDSYDYREIETPLCLNMMNNLYSMMVLGSPHTKMYVAKIKRLSTGVILKSLSQMHKKRMALVSMLVLFNIPPGLIDFLLRKVHSSNVIKVN